MIIRDITIEQVKKGLNWRVVDMGPESMLDWEIVPMGVETPGYCIGSLSGLWVEE